MRQSQAPPTIPATGYLRLPQIIGTLAASPRKKADAKNAGRKTEAPFYQPIIPVSKSNWWAGVKTGRYPKSIKLGPRTTVWTASSIRELCEQGASREEVRP